MNFEEFKQEVVDNIKDHLPEKYEDANVQINEVMKNNETLSGLTIRTDDVNVTPTIYLEGFFREYEDGTSMDEILDNIADVYQNHALDHDFDVSQITDYEKVEDKIIPRVVGIEGNDELLAQRPHEVVAEDLAIIYAVDLGSGPDGGMSVPITNALMESYGIDQEQLHEVAMKNMDENMGITFKGMNEVMAEMMMPQMLEMTGGDEEAAKEMLASMVPPEEAMYVVSNEEKLNGAVAVFDQKTMDDIAEKVGGDFYVLPSSIHEALVVPMTEDGPDRAQLESMVREVNETQVAPQDRLSDNVYAYDAESHELMRADKYEEHQQEKENAKDEVLADKPKVEERKMYLKGDIDPSYEKQSFKEQIADAKMEAKAENEKHKPDPEKAKAKKKNIGIDD